MSKIDESIFLSLENEFELIVKYSGDLKKISDEGYIVEILSCHYAIITTQLEKLEKLLLYDEIEYIEKSKQLSVEVNKFENSICVDKISSELNMELNGEGVIIGIIDSGIDYKHEDFKSKDGTTRIKYIWDLSVKNQNAIGLENVKKGIIYSENEINTAIKEGIGLNHFDYIGHGTAVAGVCAGNTTGIAPKSDLIIVKVNERIFDNFAKNTDIMRAIKFIIDTAISLNKPVVLNISFGTNDGAHDGSSLFEVYIDEMCETYKNNIVIAVGNEGISGHHCFEKIKQDENTRIEFQTSQTLKNFNMSIWKSFVDEIEIELISSDGDKTGILVEKSGVYSFNLGKFKITVIFVNPTPYSVDQEIFINFEALSELIQNEIWFLNIFGKKIVQGEINIWLPVVEQSGSETFFFNANEDTTLTIPSTSSKCISVGGYNQITDSFSSFSGRGFDRKGLIKPDIVAPCVDITTTKVGGGYGNYTGTSFAAPFVTGSIALMMQWGIANENDIFLYGERVKALLHRGAIRDSNLEYPNKSYGYGKLCVGESILLDNEDINLTRQESENEFINIAIEYTESVKELINEIDYLHVEKELEGGFAIVKIPYKNFSEFLSKAGYLISYHIPFVLTLCGKRSLEESGIAKVQAQSFLQLDGRDTLIAIIDTGIDYNNKIFKYEDNTSKIEYIWDMTIEGNPPEGFNFGTEYNNTQINFAINSSNSYEIIPTEDTNGHGTFLASIASGRLDEEGNIGASPESRLIIVKLRNSSSIENEINFIPENNVIEKYSSIDIMLAIEYVIMKKRELKKPISIGITQGTNSGSHDGRNIFERYIENLSLKIGNFISVASGDEADKRHHTMKTIPISESYSDIELMVGENEEKFMCLVWSYGADKISIEIITPLGENTGIISSKNGTKYINNFILDNSIVEVNYNVYLGNGNQSTQIGFKNPTSGIWIIRVHGDSIVNGVIHVWLPCSGLISDRTYFPISSQEYTITSPATARSIISSGGYNHIDDALYPPSGRGPSREFLLKPTLVAPSVNVVGHYPSGIGTMTGTSGGNAHVIGAASLLMQWAIKNSIHQKINTLTIGNMIVSGCIQFPQLDAQNVITGFGKMNLMNSFKNLKI